MGKPFRWADTCCCSTADRWVEIQTGKSLIGDYGRAYTCEADARQWMNERGGLVGAILKVMRQSGLPKTDTPKIGDIGIIKLKSRICMAICLGDFWFSRDENGFIFARHNSAIRAWFI